MKEKNKTKYKNEIKEQQATKNDWMKERKNLIQKRKKERKKEMQSENEIKVEEKKNIR